MNKSLTISAHIYADIDTVWDAYNSPRHITWWNAASKDWYCPKSQSIFKEWGRFTNTMASRDWSMKFDFEGTFTKIVDKQTVAYMLDNERNVEVKFQDLWESVTVSIEFEPEAKNDIDIQKNWWKAMLSNFAEYAESL